MEVTFVYPFVQFVFFDTPYPPLGIAYLSSVLKQQCDFISKISLIDGMILKESDYWQAIDNLETDIVLISAITIQIKGAKKVAKRIKQIKPDTLIIAGGPGPSGLSEQELFNESNIDIVVKGEAEEILPALLTKIYRKHPFHDIPNLIYREKEIITSTPLSNIKPDILSLP